MEIINFISKDGLIMNGLLYKSNTKTSKIILSIHGMTSDCFKERDKIIAQKANKENIDYICFNNRGSGLVNYIQRKEDGKKILCGTAFEDVLDGYNDIIGAIEKIVSMGYKEIYLQGHSLGCTKIVYTYNRLKNENSKLLEYIHKVILLSLVDIPNVLKTYMGKDFENYMAYAIKKESEWKKNDFMPENPFIEIVSVKTFLRYMRDNEEINFAKYESDDKFKYLNNITVPLFMRWGNNKEMILQDAEFIVNKLNNNIENKNKDINFIDGADHGYHGKLEILSNQIIEFIGRKLN